MVASSLAREKAEMVRSHGFVAEALSFQLAEVTKPFSIGYGEGCLVRSS